MTPRPNKPAGNETTPPPQEGTPRVETGVQDHNFHTQAVFEIHKQIGKLETGLGSIEIRLSSVESKLGGVRDDLALLNTTINTVKPILSWIGRGIFAIVAFGLTIAGMWIKHHFGW